MADLYLTDAETDRLLTWHGVAKTASALTTDRSRKERHVGPLLGTRKMPAVTRAGVSASCTMLPAI